MITSLVFSYMQGTIHPYYTVALAPAIAALVALAGHAAWTRRETVTGRLTCAALVLAAGLWSFVLLSRTSSWQPELRWTVLVLVLRLAAGAGLALPVRSRLGLRALLAAGLVAAIIGTAAFGLATAASARTGSIPTAGPAAAASDASAGGMGTGGMGTGGGAPAGTGAGPASRGGTAKSGPAPTGSAPGGSETGGSAPSGSSASGGGGGSMPSGEGGATASTALARALKATSTKWAAAVVGDQSAAEVELATGTAVISIGGWSGTDLSPTLAQFEHYAATGQVKYFIASGGTGMGGGPGSTSSQITKWVEAHYAKVTIGGQTVYDLSLLLEVVSDAVASSPAHHYELKLPDQPFTVAGDADRLHQVFANLLANTRVHTHPGTRVVVLLSSSEPGTAVVTVLDDGPGIDAVLLPTIFERFARGAESRHRDAGSTGLGLAIVRAIVESHHGTVQVVSRPGQTAFIVRLPLQRDLDR